MKSLLAQIRQDIQLSFPCIYPKGTTLFHEGEAVKKVALIIEGEVVLKHYTLEGDTLVLSTIKQNAFFGDYLIHHPEPYYPGNLETSTNTIIQYFDKDTLDTILVSNKAFRDHYLKQLSIKAIAMNSHNKILKQKSIKEKLLLYLEQQINQQKSLNLAIPSKVELAQYLNVARPSLHRTLNTLEKTGFIKVFPHRIVIKKDLCML